MTTVYIILPTQVVVASLRPLSRVSRLKRRLLSSSCSGHLSPLKTLSLPRQGSTSSTCWLSFPRISRHTIEECAPDPAKRSRQHAPRRELCLGQDTPRRIGNRRGPNISNWHSLYWRDCTIHTFTSSLGAELSSSLARKAHLLLRGLSGTFRPSSCDHQPEAPTCPL